MTYEVKYRQNDSKNWTAIIYKGDKELYRTASYPDIVGAMKIAGSLLKYDNEYGLLEDDEDR